MEIPTIGQLLEKQAVKYKGKIFLHWQDTEVSYEELNKTANKVANCLASVGVKHGDKVALMSGNCPEFLYTLFGATKLGAVIVPINPMLKSEEVQYAIENSDAVVLIASKVFAHIVDSIKPLCPLLSHVWYIGEVEGKSNFSEIMSSHNHHNPSSSSVKPTDIASIIYTSGTTGRPKGVMLSHSNYFHNATQISSSVNTTENDRALCFLPLFHVNAQVASCYGSLVSGASMVLLAGFSPIDFLQTLSKYKISSFSAVPTVYSILNTLPNTSQYDLSSLRYCACGAAPLPFEVFQEFQRKYKAVILEGYGLSEGTCASTLNRFDKRSGGSIGVALPGQQIKIMDSQNNEMKLGQIGEICIKGPTVMQGYYKNPKATAETIKEGWLHTGDLGCVDSNDLFYITGRKKEMIIRGGENIYPKEIEEILYRHPSVLDCAVIGLPDKIWGEEVAVAFVLREGKQFSEQDVFSYCKKHLADYKCPKTVKYMAQFPRTATGKIQKNKIIEQLTLLSPKL